MRGRQWVAPSVTVAALVAVVAALAVGLGGSGAPSLSPRPSASPPPLHLVTGSGWYAATAAGVRTGPRRYVLTSALPAGTPAAQPVYRPRAATASDVTAVAAALGLTGPPTPVTGGWVIRRGGNRLGVHVDGTWTYGLDCGRNQPISDENLDVGCAVAEVTGQAVAVAVRPARPGATGVPEPPPVQPLPVQPPPPPPAMTAAQARAYAAPILDRLGLGDAVVRTDVGPQGATVSADPAVDGKASAGWTTTIELDAHGTVTSANGWLVSTTAGARYPLISAKHAFELLQRQPQPMIAMCVRRPDGKPGCGDMTVTITGATLGVALEHDGATPVLVPAWLFSPGGADAAPLVQVAIDPRFLAPPPAPRMEAPVGVAPGARAPHVVEVGPPQPAATSASVSR